VPRPHRRGRAVQPRLQPGAEAGQGRQRGQLPQRGELVLQPVRDLRAAPRCTDHIATSTDRNASTITVMMNMHVLRSAQEEPEGGGVRRARTGAQGRRAPHRRQASVPRHAELACRAQRSGAPAWHENENAALVHPARLLWRAHAVQCRAGEAWERHAGRRAGAPA